MTTAMGGQARSAAAGASLGRRTALHSRLWARALAAIGAALMLVATGAQSSAGTVREARKVAGFHRVLFTAVGELHIRQGTSEALVIEAERRLLPKIVAEVKAGVLELRIDEGTFTTRYPIRFYLTVTTLERLRSEASGDISIEALATPRFALELAGSGDVRIGTIATSRLAVRVSGSSTIDIAGGRVGQQAIDLTGSGDYRAPGLASDETRVSISGSGDVTVMASKRLVAGISGSGDIRYAGEPIVIQTITGAGTVGRL